MSGFLHWAIMCMQGASEGSSDPAFGSDSQTLLACVLTATKYNFKWLGLGFYFGVLRQES